MFCFVLFCFVLFMLCFVLFVCPFVIGTLSNVLTGCLVLVAKCWWSAQGRWNDHIWTVGARILPGRFLLGAVSREQGSFFSHLWERCQPTYQPSSLLKLEHISPTHYKNYSVRAERMPAAVFGDCFSNVSTSTAVYPVLQVDSVFYIAVQTLPLLNVWRLRLCRISPCK